VREVAKVAETFCSRLEEEASLVMRAIFLVTLIKVKARCRVDYFSEKSVPYLSGFYHPTTETN